ncbi:MAG: bifunctional glutamate N-acetyltransferase/amino-acid acetyltransferase ArgJ [Calditerrivibrio sp.]|nr:bifunctional glutamate N-acetyltransferase/amino-acid acetyltransferase ArgJ [Calditerrivibrio sp.]
MIKIVEDGGVCTPLGFSSGAVSADIKGNKSGKLDLGILLSEVPCEVASTFTKNRMKAAPVIAAEKQMHDGGEFFGVLVNSGNANACTGKQGIDDYFKITSSFAHKLGLKKKSLFMSSTGVIGVRLPVDKILSKADDLLDSIDDDDILFSKAIMTTDTKPKRIAVLVETDNGIYVVGGTAKGAGMIAPSMATMLAFITTDAMVEGSILQKVLNNAVESSFNSITVDGDMSTNDTCFIFANGLSGIKIAKPEEIEKFQTAVKFVCDHLAKEIVMDGEGATKLVHIQIDNAKSYEDAKNCAFKIANSPLVKTMFFGSDPNWGRLMASIGASLIDIDPETVDIYFNDIKYVENSVLIDPSLEKDIHEIMLGREYLIRIDLKVGNHSCRVMTSDFSYDYIKINADYRS